MKDVSSKVITQRIATARSILLASPQTIQLIREQKIPKGNPLEVAKVAAVQAAKNTPNIIPYCHAIPIDYVGVNYELFENSIEVKVTVKANYKTGVEMEALTAASVAALTLYDMLKMLDESMCIQETVLLEKKGGKSDYRHTAIAKKLKAAVLVMSDSIAAGEKSDRSGQLIVDRLTSHGVVVVDFRVISDDAEAIEEAVREYTAENVAVDLLVTTGGTGISLRDNTTQVVEKLMDYPIPGIAEAMRAYGQERTPYSMLSRSSAGIRGTTLILSLPGSTGGVSDSLDAVFPAIFHGFKMRWGYGHPTANDSVAELV